MSGPAERLGPEWDLFFRNTDKKGLLPWQTVAAIWNRRTGDNLSEVQVNAIGQRAIRKVKETLMMDPAFRRSIAQVEWTP